MSESIDSELEEQIEHFKNTHSDLKIGFIDTLQMVRNESESIYGSDYKELSVLKALADRIDIAIVLVHHTRKCSDNDPFNMISGSTGLSGCVDRSMVLIETKRGSRKAKLHCVGRDIENQDINVVFENSRWKGSLPGRAAPCRSGISAANTVLVPGSPGEPQYSAPPPLSDAPVGLPFQEAGAGCAHCGFQRAGGRGFPHHRVCGQH